MAKIFICAALFLSLISCDAENRLSRILRNNPDLERVDYVVDTLRVFDHIVNDSIVYRDSIVVREGRTVETPPTRYEIRYKYRTDKQREKTIRDSLDAIIIALRIEKRKDVRISNNDTKQKKSDNRTQKNAQRWDGVNAFLWSCAAVLGMVSVLFFVMRYKGSRKNSTFDETRN